MIKKLSVDQILKLIEEWPEQPTFDYKSRGLNLSDDNAKGELVKDFCALANSITTEDAYIIYGINPEAKDPVPGIYESIDDAKLQQLISAKVPPNPNFLYHELLLDDKRIGVLQIFRTGIKPYVVSKEIGRIKEGQVFIRRGSSTKSANHQDMIEMIISENNSIFMNWYKNLNINLQQQKLNMERIRLNREGMDRAERQMRELLGF